MSYYQWLVAALEAAEEATTAHMRACWAAMMAKVACWAAAPTSSTGCFGSASC